MKLKELNLNNMIFYVAEVQEKLEYNFNDLELLRQCFTHPSYLNEGKYQKDYDRLEYLGMMDG